MSLVPHLAPYHFFYAPNDIRASFTQAAPVLILYPRGTSTDGGQCLPSALPAPAKEAA